MNCTEKVRFPLPLDFLLWKILDLHLSKVLRERPTTPYIVSSLVQTQGAVSPCNVMCESTDLGQYLLKVWLVWACETSLTAWWRCFVSTSICGDCWTVLSVRIKISRIPSTAQNYLLYTWNSWGTTSDLKENTWWTVFLTNDCLLSYSSWFWFSSFLHSNEFFALCQAGIKLNLGQWCLEAAIQHFRLGNSTESLKSDHLCCYWIWRAWLSYLCRVFLTPDFHLVFI